MRLRPRRLLGRALQARLVLGLLVLLALACLVLGAGTTLALRAFLVQRLDQQLESAGDQYAERVEHGRENPLDDSSDGEEARQVPGAVGTLGARLADGQLTITVVPRGGDRATVVDPSASIREALAALPADGRPRSRDLDALGDYRLRAVNGRDGDVLISGLPLRDTTEVLLSFITVETAVFVVVLLAAGAGGALFVRRSLRPLHRVTRTARQVAELPLGSGEVDLPAEVSGAGDDTEAGLLADSFNHMLSHVGAALSQRQASEDRLRQFIADASHELRTPVAAIRGHAELARRTPDPVPASVQLALRRVESESIRMGLLVDELLLLARLDTGRPLAREQVDLTQLVVEATADAHAAGPGHRWELDLPDEPVVVTGDPHRLHQVIGNLLTNARTHTPPGTLVRVGVSGGRDRATIVVTDDGPGIRPDLLDRVFQRFVHGTAPRPDRSSDAADRRASGTGLGLAIARAVVHAHQGAITVTSRPGRTTFRIELPTGDRATSVPGGSP